MPCAPSNSSGTSSSASAAGAVSPVLHAMCEQATSFVAGPAASASCENGAVRITMPRWSRAAISAPRSPGCSSGAVSTSSPGLKVEAGQQPADAVARRGRDRDVGGVSSEQPGVGAAKAVDVRREALVVGARTALAGGDLPGVARRLSGGGGDRSAGARVQVREPLEDREPGAQRGDVHSSSVTSPRAPQAERVSGRRRATARRRRGGRASRRGGTARARERRRGRPCRPRSPRSGSRTGTGRGTCRSS